MLCCRVSQEVRPVSLWKHRTSASSHTCWYSRFRTSSRFYQCAPWRIFGRAAWESSHSLWGVALSALAAALSSGNSILPGCFGLWQAQTSSDLLPYPCNLFITRKSRHPEMTASILRMACHGLPKTCSAKPASPARPPHLGSSIIAMAKPEHFYTSNQIAIL
jgi:hypothetical protein